MNFKTAIAGGGALLAALTFTLGTLLGTSGVPEKAADVAFSPANGCPTGWADSSATDEHTVVFSCSKDGWLVILNGDKSFNYAWDGRSPEFEYDSSRVPGWR